MAKIMKTVLLAGLLVCPALAWGQWQVDGLFLGYMTPAFNASIDAVNIGNGNIAVVWDGFNQDVRNIHVQLVDSSGYVHWDYAGLLVCPDTAHDQIYASVLGDDSGGVFVVWSDYRHVAAEGLALYGQHLDSFGNRLWDPYGVRLTYGSYGHSKAKLCSDGYGGFIIVDDEIMAQRVSRDGDILWDSTGIFLSRIENVIEWLPITYQTGVTSFITCWVRSWLGDSAEYGSDIYMQRFDLDGNIYWGASGKPAVHYEDNQSYLEWGHDMVADGQGGVVVAWIDQRNITPWSMVYADHFNSNGQSMWAENGQPASSGPAIMALETQVFKLGDKFIFLHSGNSGFRASLLNGTGNDVWGSVRILDTMSVVGRAIMDPEAVFKYVSVSNTYPPWKIDTTGHEYWVDRGYWVGYYRQHVLSDSAGGMITVGNDGYPYVRISRVYANGKVGGDTTGIQDGDSLLPYAFRLGQNHPNPFNGQTIIEYALPENTDVTLELYNIIGQSLIKQTLPNQSAGINKITLNLNNYPSGVYLLRLTTTEGIENKIKLTLIK